VANSRRLKLSGIDKNTASPFGGEILKDKQSGEPTGMLIDAAQGLLRSQVPSTTAADAERAIILGVKRDIELGWVRNPGCRRQLSDVDLYRKLYGQGAIQTPYLQSRLLGRARMRPDY